MISFRCAGCNQKLRANVALAGKTIKCPKCGQHSRVATPAQPLVTQGRGSPPVERTPQSDTPIHETIAYGSTDEASSNIDTLGGGAFNRAAEKCAYDFLAPPQAQDELGRLGNYRILKVLGQGGMGIVFLAEDTQLERKVAIKVMSPSLTVSESAKRRFLREAKTTASIKHDHIVIIHQVAEDRGIPFLAMEFLEGKSLDECIKQHGVFPVRETIRIGREIAEGLAQAHAKGLIHRDIKPSNIWLEGKKRRAKILDFGLARATGDDSNLTHSGAIMGTPAYMAPEQGRGEDVDQRCDLFSLGCVLYQLCTGTMPFKGNDTMSTLMALATVSPKAPADLTPGFPTAVSDLVMKLMAKERSERYANAEEVVAEMQRIESSEQSLASQPANDETMAAPSQTFAPISVQPRHSLRRNARSQRVNRIFVRLALFGVLSLLVLAGIVVRLRTGDGTLVVDIDQPDSLVQVLDSQGRIEIREHSGVDKVSISLVPGKHRLRVEKNGFQVYGTDFQIESGSRTTITARLEALRSVDAPPNKAPALTKLLPTRTPQPTNARMQITNELGMKFMWIPPGEFVMGSPKDEIGRQDKETQHSVTLTKGFYMSAFLVTQEQWQAVMGNNPSQFKGEMNLPVEMITWEDCQEFIGKLREKDNRPYRLPTEAEWEYACRAGTTTAFWFGETISSDQANYDGVIAYGKGQASESRRKTTPIDTFPPNPWGLHDMHGNLFQWCQDWYQEAPKNDAVDPLGPGSGQYRVLRGGSWCSTPETVRSAFSLYFGPSDRNTTCGLRLCFSAESND